ncbi:MAG: cupredoxin domain-containing protein [Solirubrobacteraceae bacterium]
MRSRALAGALATTALLGAAAIPALGAGGGGGTGAHTSAVHDVTLSHIRYHPGTLSIKRGDTVTWLWRDNGTEHNVTGGSFKSKTMTHGSFSVRFTKAGAFNYHCTIHGKEGMVGKVVVH